ncbi:hypothetical protein lbkm_0051 [Lachnospiraceae bacterium KM106-2]|nr:hypothetical protein lbkm_0051 [Lachnospiraceae bacterium KM106-2]
MINRQQEHCAVLLPEGLFDISGRISKFNFRLATDRDISFMKKNYKPNFDVLKLEQYLDQMCC